MYLDKLLQLEKSQKIAIIGLGQENLQFLNWLTNTVRLDPLRILIADQKNIDLSSPFLKDFSSLGSNIFSGSEYLKVLEQPNIAFVFKAPGIWSLKPEFENFRRIHGQDSVQSSLVFFFEKYRKQIIAITGTKGKSTTSSLLNHLLTNSNSIKSHYCGNTTNISPYQFWTELNQVIDPEEFFVVEASSFQLQDLAFAHISPKYGIITNYHLDHQDQHATAEEYWKSKDTVFAYQKEGEVTLVTETVLQKNQSKNKLSHTQLVTQDLANSISSLFKTTLEGDHNRSNLAQAVIVYLQVVDSAQFQISDISILGVLRQYEKSIQSALSTYKPLSHRQELIMHFTQPISIETKTVEKVINLTVRLIDDGAATEPDAVIAAIKTLTNETNKYIWLYISGKDKGGVLDTLTQTILETQVKNQLYKVHYCGQVGQNLLSHIYKSLGLDLLPQLELLQDTVKNDFTNKAGLVGDFKNWLTDQVSQLEEINEWDKIHKLLEKDIILNIVLSPCGASFDEFSNYQERSYWFQDYIKAALAD